MVSSLLVMIEGVAAPRLLECGVPPPRAGYFIFVQPKKSTQKKGCPEESPLRAFFAAPSCCARKPGRPFRGPPVRRGQGPPDPGLVRLTLRFSRGAGAPDGASCPGGRMPALLADPLRAFSAPRCDARRLLRELQDKTIPTELVLPAVPSTPAVSCGLRRCSPSALLIGLSRSDRRSAEADRENQVDNALNPRKP